MVMRYILALTAALVAQQASAAPAEMNCKFNDGRRFTSIASNGKVIFRWGEGEWKDGHAEVKDNVITVVHILPAGYMRVSFGTYDNRGYGVVRSLPDHKIVWESAALCAWRE
jgi:hypothetical protein